MKMCFGMIIAIYIVKYAAKQYIVKEGLNEEDYINMRSRDVNELAGH